MSNFIPIVDVESCRFLNLRMLILAEVCPHCARTDTLKAHGFLKAACGSIRGIRLYPLWNNVQNSTTIAAPKYDQSVEISEIFYDHNLVKRHDEVLKLHRDDLGMTVAEIDAALDGLCVIAERWKLSPGWIPVLRDPDDEPIFQLAIEARVPYIVTRNIRDFEGAERFGIVIIQPADFLKLLRQPQP